MPFLTRKELLLVFILSLFASSLSLLPTLWTYLKTPPGLWFVGFQFLHPPWDINVYLAAMRQGFLGHWQFLTPYDTTLTQPLPAYFLFYLLLGHLSRIFSLPIVLVYHLSGLFLTVLLFFVLYFFLAVFVEGRKWRILAIFLIAFGGGLSWLVFPKSYFADLRLAGATFFQILPLPHFLLNQIFFLLSLLFAFWAAIFKRRHFIYWGTFSGLGLAIVHPYSLAVVVFVSGGYLFLTLALRQRLAGRRYLLEQLFFWVLTLLIFYFIFRGNPLLTQKGPLIFPWEILWGYGGLTFLAVLGAYSFWQEKSEKSIFLLSWLLFHFFFLYLPLPFWPMVGLKGYFIILVLAAVAGLKRFLVMFTRPRLIVFLVVLLSCLTQFLAVLSLFSPFYLYDGWTYLKKDEKQAFDFLLKNTGEGSTVLSSYKIGNFIPANSNGRVYLGHDLVSFDFGRREKNIENFYAGKLSVPPSQFLKNEKIDYVFWKPEEKKLGDLDLTKESYLENIYQNEKVIIFKVK